MATPVPTGIILETVFTNGSSKDCKNLLFLGDGFDGSVADRQLFDKTIDEILLRFFKKAPYNLKGVKNKFNVFKAFTPSASSGISCASPVDAAGLTISDNAGTAGAPIGTLVDKPSALGLTYGYIIGGTPLPRLIGPKTGDATLIPDFIATLTNTAELLADTAIPDCWAPPPGNMIDVVTGKDYGLVVVLINDDKHGGGGADSYAMVCLGKGTGFPGIFPLATGGVDHVPVSARNLYDSCASVALHELGHSHFKLEDEYSEINTPATATTKDFYSETPNAVTNADVTDATGINPALIKWNKDAFAGSPDKLISTAVFNYMQTNHKALFERPVGTICANVGYDDATKYPPASVWNGIRYPQRIIGIYEGGAREGCGVYSPAGSCRMRNINYDTDFCYVCKHAIIEKIDFTLLESLYKKFYPR